jgi:hypothetical protein
MNREQMIREARTIEAMRKGYMGMEGKFSIVAKRLGEAIIEQGSNSFSQSFLPDPFELEDEDEMPTISEEDQSHEIGMYFDGLSRGINLSIIVRHYHREIVCEYQGYTVYRELAGELEAYVPHEIWENQLEKIYDSAQKVEKKQKPQERKKLIEAANKKRQELLQEFKLKWGLT